MCSPIREGNRPPVQSLARSSNLATGAAWALDRLRQENLEDWMQQAVVCVFTLRQQAAFSDKAIARAIERVLNNPPAPAPTIELGNGKEISTGLGTPAGLRRCRMKSPRSCRSMICSVG